MASSRDEFVKSVKTAAQVIGETTLMTAAVKAVPFLAHPIMNAILRSIVSEIMETLINSAEYGAFYLYVDFRTNQQGRDFYTAAMKLVQAKLGGKPEEIDRAQTEMLKKFARLIVLGA